MRVSVIVPAHNAAATLPLCLSSLLAQTHEDVETIVVDDGSTDETARIAEAAGVRLIQVEKSAGAPAARNLGLGEATGGLIQFLDADDWLAPQKVARGVDMLAGHPSAHLAVCQTRLFTHAPEDADADWNALGGSPLERFMRHDVVWQTAAPLWRADFLRGIGGFRPSLPIAQDYELHLRALLCGASVALSPQEDNFYRRPGARNVSSAGRSRYAATLETVFGALEPLWPSGADALLGEDWAWVAFLHARSGDPVAARRCLARALAHSPRPVWRLALPPLLALAARLRRGERRQEGLLAALGVDAPAKARWMSRTEPALKGPTLWENPLAPRSLPLSEGERR